MLHILIDLPICFMLFKPLMIDRKSYEKWRNALPTDRLSGVHLERPSLRSLVALALLERAGESLSYAELTQTIAQKCPFEQGVSPRAVEKFLDREGLRVALSTLSQALSRNQSELAVQSTKIGREARFSLEKNEKTLGPQVSGVDIFHLQTKLTDPREIARALLRDGGGLPFASAYAPYRSAAKWLTYASGYSSKKDQYEADSFAAFKLDEVFFRPTVSTVCLVGLATGEGLGEIDLIAHLLVQAKPGRQVVHYLGIDSSEFLLAAHAQLVRQRFAEAIAQGRLKVRFAVGDAYDLAGIVEAVNPNGDGFLSQGPIACTFFGNCLGNNEYHEWDLFRSVLEAFPKSRTCAILTGVSLLRRTAAGKPIQEKYTLDPFWLETPRHLLHELKLLQSLDSKGTVIAPEHNKEFQPSADELKQYIPFGHYETAAGIRGVVYRFHYTLKQDLITSDSQERMSKGQAIHVYSIIKYDLPSLLQAVARRNLVVKDPSSEYKTLIIKSGKEEFHYAVFAALRMGTKRI